MNDTSGEQVDDIWLRLKQGLLSLLQRRLLGGQRKAFGESKFGNERNMLLRIYLRREDCGRCGRQMGAKINIWM